MYINNNIDFISWNCSLDSQICIHKVTLRKLIRILYNILNNIIHESSCTFTLETRKRDQMAKSSTSKSIPLKRTTHGMFNLMGQ